MLLMFMSFQQRIFFNQTRSSELFSMAVRNFSSFLNLFWYNSTNTPVFTVQTGQNCVPECSHTVFLCRARLHCVSTYPIQSAPLGSVSRLMGAITPDLNLENLDSVFFGAAPRKAHFGSKSAEKVNAMFAFLYFWELPCPG